MWLFVRNRSCTHQLCNKCSIKKKHKIRVFCRGSSPPIPSVLRGFSKPLGHPTGTSGLHTTLGLSAGCPLDFENPLGLRGICAKIPSKKPESPIQVLVTRVGYLHPMTGGFPDSYPPVLGCDILSYNPHFDIIPHLRGISNFGKKYRPQIWNFQFFKKNSLKLWESFKQGKGGGG